MDDYIIGVFNYVDGKSFIHDYKTYEEFEESAKSLKKAVKNIVYYEITCNFRGLKQFKEDLRQGNPVYAEAKEYIKEEPVKEPIPEPVQEIAAKKSKDPDIKEFLRQEREFWGPLRGDYSMVGNEYDMDLDAIPFGEIKIDDKSHYAYVSYNTWKAIEKKGTMDELFKYYKMGVAYFTEDDYIYINPYTGETKMDMDFWYKYKDEPLFDRMLNSNRGGKKNRQTEFKSIRHLDMNEILLDN